MSKLLNKPLKAFTLYALVILVCSVPVYYWVVDVIWISGLDDHNEIVKTQIANELKNSRIDEGELTNVIRVLNSFEPGLEITPVDKSLINADSIYTTIKNPHGNKGDEERFRGLVTFININGNAYRLTIETNVEEADETLVAISVITFLFFLLLMGGFIILNKRISAKVWQPFRDTLEKLKQFDLTKGQKMQFEKSDVAEFEELNNELTRLIDRNNTAFYQQKTFIENASHELQTPMALLKSKIDLLRQQKDFTQTQWELIDAINASLSKVSRINKNLLLLANIENMHFSDNGTVDVAGVLRENIELLSDYIEGKNVLLETGLIAPCVIVCNKTLLEILLNNLLINAVHHNTDKGKVTVTLSQNVLTIANTGEKALGESSLFKRFAISSSKTTSSGLGLAIVKEVCNRYGWRVSYAFTDNRHTFSVVFN